MKKFFDRYLFSRMGLQIAFSVLAILAFSVLLTCIKNGATAAGNDASYSQLSWGFCQLADGGSVTTTLKELDQIRIDGGNVPVILVIALLSWIIGMILCGFVTGAIVNAFDGRRDKIKSGQTRYKFKDHGLILGWGGQGVAVVQSMLQPQKMINEVLIVSETPAGEITATLKKILNASQLRNIYIYNCSVDVMDNIRKLQAELARTIVILGEQNHADKDGEALHTEQLLQKYVREKITADTKEQFTNLPIKLYLHLEDPALYLHARSEENGFVEDDIIDIELCNFYESWAWYCWSKANSADNSGAPYLPLRHKRCSTRVELFVIGSDPMAQALVNYAIPLLNYGENSKHRITLFDADGDGEDWLPKRQVADSLPEVEIVSKRCSGGSNEAGDIIYEAAVREDTSVTVVIAVPGADAAVKAYAALSHQVRRKDISVLIRQSTECANCIEKGLLQTRGDHAELRYFGMTDILPWMDPSRGEYGRDINYSYETVAAVVAKSDLKQIEPPEKFLEILNIALQCPYGKEQQDEAEKQWQGILRWKRWSSISTGDSFKEKAFAFPDCTSNAENCVVFLRAEHNRWWAERLLAGWCFSEKRDNKEFLHPMLTEFEKLSAKTQCYDLLGIVAMKNAGLLK